MSKEMRNHIDNFRKFLLKENKENIVDYILDKINKYGIQNLSKQDKEVLNGVYKDKNINTSIIENFIFNLLCIDEEKDNILNDTEDKYDIHTYYIIPIYDYCKIVFDRVKELFEKLNETPNVCDFFETYSSYNTSNYTSLFGNNRDWSIGKSFKESFERFDIYFEDDEYFDIKDKLINCFKI
jgi:hypothetical protein